MARLRTAPSPKQAPPATQSTRRALKEKTNTAARKQPVSDKDGNTEGLVKNARPKRGQAKKAAQNEDELVMAGGLGERQAKQQITPPSEAPATTDEVVESDGPQPPPPARTNRRPPRMARKAVQSQSQNKVFDDMKKRMQATAPLDTASKKVTTAMAPPRTNVPSSDALPTKPAAAQESNIAVPEQSEHYLSPSPSHPGKLSSVKNKRASVVQPGSAIRPQGTPAVESSILALKNFKRRPRQPSMLQMVQRATASARPSAVHAQSIGDPNVFDVEGADDIEDEFAPEAEGTPLHVGKAKQRLSVTGKRSSEVGKEGLVAPQNATASKKRKPDEMDFSSSALDALRAKRQKSMGPTRNDDTLSDFRSSHSGLRTSSARQKTPAVQSAPDVQVINSSPSASPSTESSPPNKRRLSEERDIVVPSTENEQQDTEQNPVNDAEDDEAQDIPNGTMADPASSSPLPTHPPATQADPQTQPSPPRSKRERAKKPAKPMTTAALQSLLPKRRKPLQPRHHKTEYDVESDSEDDNNPLDTGHLDEDEDELGGKLRRRRTQNTAAAKARKSATAKGKSRQSKAAPTTSRKASAPPARRSVPPPTRTKQRPRTITTTTTTNQKTYARATTTTTRSDKENSPPAAAASAQDQEDGEEAYESLPEDDASALPDTSTSMHDAAASGELEAARRKFAEVDEWEIEFESVEGEEGRSSSQAWR